MITNRLAKTMRLTWLFYKNYCLASILITATCALLLWRTGFVNPVFFYVFWFKLITLGIIFYFINREKKNEFFYYCNLGLSQRALWISSLSFDFLFFIFCLSLVQAL